MRRYLTEEEVQALEPGTMLILRRSESDRSTTWCYSVVLGNEQGQFILSLPRRRVLDAVPGHTVTGYVKEGRLNVPAMGAQYLVQKSSEAHTPTGAAIYRAYRKSRALSLLPQIEADYLIRARKNEKVLAASALLRRSLMDGNAGEVSLDQAVLAFLDTLGLTYNRDQAAAFIISLTNLMEDVALRHRSRTLMSRL